MGSWSSKPREQACADLRNILVDRYVGDWDWDGLQSALESKLPLAPEAPEALETMRSLFVCCMADIKTPTLQHHDFILHLLRSIDFENELCRLESVGGFMGLLTASWGMHFRVLFKGMERDDSYHYYATSVLEEMIAQGISLTFPVHFEVISFHAAVFDFGGFSVTRNFEVTEDEAEYRYDFVDPADRALVVRRLLDIRAAIESEARRMQVPSEKLWRSRRGPSVTPAKPPKDKFIPSEKNLLVQLKRGKRFRRRDIAVAVNDKPAAVVDHAVDLVSIAKLVASDEAIEMWKKWKTDCKGAGAGVSDRELEELAADLVEQLGKPEVVDDVAKFGDFVETKCAQLEGPALATSKSLIVSSNCEKGRLWDYVLCFLRWIGFPDNGCFLERTSLSRATFLSASAGIGMHIRVFFTINVPEFTIEDEFMELLAVGHLAKLAEVQAAVDFPVPFYVVNADGRGGFSFRVFWVSKELQVLGWRGLFDPKYFITYARQRGLIASIFAAINRRIVAEHQQLREQGIELQSPRSVTMDGGVERVEVATTVDAEGACHACTYLSKVHRQC